jgi:hypothetical protein
MTERESSGEAQHLIRASGRSRKVLGKVLFFAGSAVFGGLAVALWDRKTLAAMRRKEEELAVPASSQDEDIY